MEKRLKEIRKADKSNGKNQATFAEFLGIPQTNLASYESGRRKPSDAVISLICQKCHVNETWLRHGDGEMFSEVTEEQKIAQITAYLAKMNVDSKEYKLFTALALNYLKLEPSQQEKVVDFFNDLVEEMQ